MASVSLSEPTHYGLGKHGWVTVQVKKPTKALAEQCEKWVEESYRSVAPARLVKALSTKD